jgi:hypothetical protein
LIDFVDDLPHNLKVETSRYLHEDTHQAIVFLREKSDGFIAWICPLLRPRLVSDNEEIFFENSDINQIYFLKSGECGFVLTKKYNNAKYIDITQGSNFGVIDIIGSLLLIDDDISETEELFDKFENWIHLKGRLKR